MEKLRVCLIGCGRAGMIHARSYMGGIHGAVLSALCDPMEENRIAASEETGVTKICSDWHDVMKDPNIDAVIFVVTPTQSHHDIVIVAASGKSCRRCSQSSMKKQPWLTANCRSVTWCLPRSTRPLVNYHTHAEPKGQAMDDGF